MQLILHCYFYKVAFSHFLLFFFSDVSPTLLLSCCRSFFAVVEGGRLADRGRPWPGDRLEGFKPFQSLNRSPRHNQERGDPTKSAPCLRVRRIFSGPSFTSSPVDLLHCLLCPFALAVDQTPCNQTVCPPTRLPTPPAPKPRDEYDVKTSARPSAVVFGRVQFGVTVICSLPFLHFPAQLAFFQTVVRRREKESGGHRMNENENYKVKK